MTESGSPVTIPNKDTFKAAEVCDLLDIKPFVLRTWENEFRDLGVEKTAGGARTYRRRDVELALRIRDLVFTEHLTLAGVRRRLEQEHLLTPPPEDAEDMTPAAGRPAVSKETRSRFARVKQDLRALLTDLGGSAGPRTSSSEQGSLAADATTAGTPARTRSGRKNRASIAPALPGFGRTESEAARTSVTPKAPEPSPKMDPAALDFATRSSPPASRRKRS